MIHFYHPKHLTKEKELNDYDYGCSTLPLDTLYIDDVETLHMIEEEVVYASNIKILSVFYLCLSYNGCYYK